MVESSAQYINSQVYKYSTSLNPDRCRLVPGEYSDMMYKCSAYYACYHLDTKTQQKSGLLERQIISIDNRDKPMTIKIEEPENEHILDYGILDFNFNLEHTKIYTANSNGSYSVFNNFCELITNTSISINNCTNIIETKLKDHLLLGFNEGELGLIDLQINKSIYLNKIHEYGIWALEVLNPNTILTGADDNTVYITDKRNLDCRIPYKEHKAGITKIARLENEENLVIVGSYDENISIFDVRYPSCSVSKQNLECSIWEIKQNRFKGRDLLSISCIYDGLKVYELDRDKKSLNRVFEFEEHKSIVYGLDSLVLDDGLLYMSCSLYDNKICYWDLSR